MPSFIEKQHLRTVEYDHSGKSTITLYCTKDENRIELLIALPLFVVASIEIAIPALAGLEPTGNTFRHAKASYYGNTTRNVRSVASW